MSGLLVARRGSLHPRRAAAAGDTIIDDFERAALDHYTGETSDFSITTTRPFTGTRSLETDTTSTAFLRVESTSGLNAYPSRGDLFEMRLYFGQNNEQIAVLDFGRNGSGTGFSVDIRPATPRLRLWNSGVGVLAQNTSLTIPTGEWLRLQVGWATNGDLDVDLHNAAGTLLGSVSANDTDYGANTDLSISVNSGTSVRRQFWVDDLKIIGAA